MWVSKNVGENVSRGGQGIEKEKERRKAVSTIQVFTNFPEFSSRDSTYGIWGCTGSLRTTQLRYKVGTAI